MRLRPPSLSIRARLVLATALLLAAASLAPSLVLPSRLEDLGRQELERRALDIARAFATASEVALDFRDRQRADEILRGLSTASGTTSGSLLLADGTALAAWGPQAPELSQGAPAGPMLRYSGDQLHVRVAIATPAGERGALQIGFNLEELRRRRAASSEVVVATALAVFAVGLGVLFLVATLVTKPVRRLTEVAGRIAAGDETAARQLQTARADETGTVAVALESVLDRLATQRAMLQSQSEASSEGILTLDLEGRIVTSNRRLTEILAFLGADPSGASWSALRPRLERGLEEPLPPWLAQDAPALPGNRPESFDLSTRDGRFLAVHASTVRRPSGEPLGLGLYLRDITGRIQDRQRIEELAQGLERRDSPCREAAVTGSGACPRLRTPPSSATGATTRTRSTASARSRSSMSCDPAWS